MFNLIKQLNRERISLSSNSFWFLFFLAFILSIIQTSDIFSVFGVKLNLILSFIAALAFAEVLSKDYFLISGFIVVFSKFIPGIDRESVSIIILIFLFFLTPKLFSISFMSICFLACISTFIFYLILDYQFLANNFLLVLIESFLNSFSAILMYGLINRIKSF